MNNLRPRSKPGQEVPECCLCHDVGWVYPDVPSEAPGYGRAVLCQCQTQKWLIRQAVAHGLPPDSKADKSFATLKERPQVKGLLKAVDAAKLLVDRKVTFLTLKGHVGLGKTHIALAIAWEWLAQGRGCCYTNTATMLDNLRATYDSSNPDDRGQSGSPFKNLFSYYCNIPLLILDDLGTEKLTEWGVEKVDSIVNNRYELRLPLMVTTNLLWEQLPPRVADRLQDKAIGRVVVLSGPSYRITQQ